MPTEKDLRLRFECYQNVLPCACSTAEDLVLGARILICTSEEAEDSRVLLAKAVRGERSLLLNADRDNYEFSLRAADGHRQHVAGGNLASDLRGLSIQQLKEAMHQYLARRRLHGGRPSGDRRLQPGTGARSGVDNT